MLIYGKRWVATAATLVLAGCQTSYGHQSPEHPYKNSASVTVHAQEKSLRLTYQFQPPVRSFQFRYTPGMIRNISWTVADPQVRLENNVVTHTSGGLIDRVDFHVEMDADSFDRVYPALRPVGDVGLVLFTDYLMLEDIELSEIRASVPAGNLVAYSSYVSSGDGLVIPLESLSKHNSHYVYFGDKNMLRTYQGLTLVSNAVTANPAIDQLRKSIGPGADWLGSFFDWDTAYQLFVIATLNADSETTDWRGDVSDNGEIFLRFFGESWLRENPELETIVQRFLFHEMVHLENAVRFKRSEGQPAWLSEGLAEYLEILYASLSGGAGNAESFFKEVTTHSSQCLRVLEEKNIGISDQSIQRGRYPYSCGVLVFWVIDGAPISPGLATELGEAWSSMTGLLEDAGNEYGVHDLFSALNSSDKHDEAQLLRALIRGPGSSVWQERDALFSSLGIDISYGYDGDWATAALTSLINHILRIHCGPGRIGFWTFDDHIQLDGDERCGSLSSYPRVDTVQGFKIFGEMRQLYQSAERACRNDQPIEFGVFGSSEKLVADCPKPIVEVPRSIVLNAK